MVFAVVERPFFAEVVAAFKHFAVGVVTVVFVAGYQSVGLAVFNHEPGLKALDNVVMTPHIGSATVETRTDMGLVVVRNIAAALEGREPPNLVRG